MKAKDKVMKLEPTVICAVVRFDENDKPDYQIWLDKKPLSKMQPRENWAWAEAFRNLNNPKPKQSV